MRQFYILTERNWLVLKRDSKTLYLLLGLPVVVSFLYFIIWKRNLLSPDVGDARSLITNFFICSVICFLIGAISFSREITKEFAIYDREHSAGVSLLSYIGSKVLFVTVFSIYSSFITIIFLEMAGSFPLPNFIIQFWFTIFLVTLSGGLTGLLISSISENQNVTTLLLIIVISPQLLFGGAIPDKQINNIGKFIGNFCATKWAFYSMVKVSGISDNIFRSGDWSGWGYFPGVNKYYVFEDEPIEPKAPADRSFVDPGKMPEPPTTDLMPGTWQSAMQNWRDNTVKAWADKVDSYKKDINEYNHEYSAYKTQMDQWKPQYAQWKKITEEGIGKAKGYEKTIYDDYYASFSSQTFVNWLIILVISLLLLIGIVIRLGIPDMQDYFGEDLKLRGER